MGGIGAGKSVVAGILESVGAAVIESDRLVHEQYRDPEVIATLREWWGDRVLTSEGGVNRRAVADTVFQESGERDRLERFLYPRIDRKREELTAIYDGDPAIRAVVIDAPKLYEAGVDKHCDAVVFVDAPYPVRVDRVARSRGWTEAELIRRESSQEPLDKKKANADYVIENNSSIDRLKTSVEKVLAQVLAAFERRS